MAKARRATRGQVALDAGDGLFTAYNDEPNRQKAHNILLPAFTKGAMKNYHDAMADTVQELIEAWKTHSVKQSWIDIPAQANRLTVEIIARAGLGHSFGKLSEPRRNGFSAAITSELGYVRRVVRVDPIPFYNQLFGKKSYRQHLASIPFS
ncbi:cytochrome P450 [Mycobacterium riyadhense]|uniref:cytochrome P450 n=1 Tax=Mycobacterium riyadhense TaxID=486698 RepID=UPI00194FED54|nr:cytochrome P450 [Mycobacterium riyadhense]